MASTVRENAPPASDEMNLEDETERFHDTQTTVRVEDTQYEETSADGFATSKPELEEAVSETQFNTGRPGSAGTVHSETIDSDDAYVLEKLTAKPKVDDHHAPDEAPSNQGGRLMSRPVSVGDFHTGIHFAFTTAAPLQLDFNGTRKKPGAAPQAEDSQVTESVSQINEELRELEGNTKSVSNDLFEQNNAQDDQMGVISRPSEDEEQTMCSREDIASMTKPRKSKKGKKRHYYSASAEKPTDCKPSVSPNFADATELNTEPFKNPEASTSNGQSITKSQQDVSLVDRAGTPEQCIAEAETTLQVSNLQVEESDGVQDITEQPNAVIVEISPSVLVEESQSPVSGLSAPESSLQARGSTMRAENPLGHRTNDTNDDADETLHRISSRHGASKVSKPQSKKCHKPSTAKPSQPSFRDPKLEEIKDYLQIVQYKLHKQVQSSMAKHAAQQENFQVQVQQVHETNEMLRDHLHEVLKEKTRLEAVVDDQKSKLDGCLSRINKFRTFVDGLGKDFSALKKEANANRTEWEKLAKESEDDRLQRDALFHQLSECAERSAQLKADALIACKDSQSALNDVTENGIHLDRHLSEKSGLLAEARDRCSNLEIQLKEQVALWQSSQEAHAELKLMLKSDNSAILDKLHLIHAELEKHHKDGEVSDIVKKTFGLVEALNSREAPTVDDIASIKAVVDGLDESVKSHLQSGAQAHEERLESSFQAQIDEALQVLKEEIGQREQYLQQGATARETIATLQEKLNTSNIRITDADSQIAAAQLKEDQLKSENATLQTKITTLQTKSSPAENAQVQLQEIKGELDLKIQALNAAKSRLADNTNELHSLQASNSSLQDQVHTLQSRVNEMQSNIVDFGPEREELKERAKRAEEHVRKEMSEHVERFEAELRTQADNEIKRLTSERDRLKKQVKPLEEELSSCNCLIQELQKDSSAGLATKEQELDKLKNVVLSRKQENECLQATLKNVRTSRKDDAALAEKYSALVAQLEVESKTLEETKEEKSRLLKQVEDLQSAANDAKRIGDQTKSELNAYRTDKEKALKGLENELAEAKKNVELADAGLEKYKASCNGAVEEAKQEGERNVNALQERLREAEGELQKAKDQSESFREAVEKIWDTEVEGFEKSKSEFNQKIVEAEAQRDDAIRENEKIRKNLENAIQEQQESLPEASEQAKQSATALQEMVQQRPSSKGSHESSQLRVPSIVEGITPTASFQPTEPTKPKKKVDRTGSTEMDYAPVPAPEELRLDSHKTGSGHSIKGKEKALGPVVEESQLAITPVMMPNVFAEFSGSDDLLSMLDNGSQQLPQTVEETQQEYLPSFAAFHTSVDTSSQAPEYKPASSTFAVPALYSTNSNLAYDQPTLQSTSFYTAASRRDASGKPTEQTQPGAFTIYEDSDNVVRTSKLKGSDTREDGQSSISLSQAEKDTYTFQKSFPHPNSASKIVHRDSRQSGTTRRPSDTQRGILSRERVLNTPGADGEGIRSRGSGQSSSPGFVHAGSGRRISTYRGSQAFGRKGQVSRTSSGLLTDPRLSNRTPPMAPKRKAEGYGAEGYENEGKKRRAADRGGASADASRFNFRPRAQSSINDLPSFSSMRSGSSSSQNGAASPQTQSRMRNLAGGSSRAARGVKKLSRDEAYNARFSQELGGR